MNKATIRSFNGLGAVMNKKVVDSRIVFEKGLVSRKVSKTFSAKSPNGDPVGLQYVREEGKEPYHFQGVKIDGVYLNMNFYGLNGADLGHNRTFHVSVCEKDVEVSIRGGGKYRKTYTYIELRKVDACPEFDLRLNVDQPELGGDVKVLGTNAFIRFVPRLAQPEIQAEEIMAA